MIPYGVMVKYFIVIIIIAKISAVDHAKKSRRSCNPKDQLQVITPEVTYTAAVLEYRPYDKWTIEGRGQEIIERNSYKIASYASQARVQGADILVAPEYGLTGLELETSNEQKFLTYTQYVPNPSSRISPCSFTTTDDKVKTLKILSCSAAVNRLYLVINLPELSICSKESQPQSPFLAEPSDACPDAGYFIYNTQVVFDRNGVVIARYRKQHLFLEPYFTPGPKDDLSAIFITDFDVAFSLQICFDVIYEHPGYSNVKEFGIRDVAMSFAWIDELPFDTANSIQNGWSRGMRVNLLSAGLHKPETNTLGSGIFPGYSGERPRYTYDRNSGNLLLVSPVKTLAASGLPSYKSLLSIFKMDKYCNYKMKTELPLNSLGNKSYEAEEQEQVPSVDPIIQEDLSVYTKVFLNPGMIEETRACNEDNFCCDLRYEYPNGNETYMFLVYSGLKPVGSGKYNIGVQICAVVRCLNHTSCGILDGSKSDSLFGPFQLNSSSFSSDLIYPIGLTRRLNLTELHFGGQTKEGFEISSNDAVRQLFVAGLCGLWYNKHLETTSK